MPERFAIIHIEFYLHQNLTGVYLLSKNGKDVSFVTRLATEVRLRVNTPAAEGGGYQYFWFVYAVNPEEAYRKECIYYHSDKPPDNQIHPAAPSGSGWKCPEKGCKWA